MKASHYLFLTIFAILSINWPTYAGSLKEFPINGTTANDTIEIYEYMLGSPNTLKVRINGSFKKYIWDDEDLNRILNGKGGNDKIIATEHANSNACLLIIKGGKGNDYIDMHKCEKHSAPYIILGGDGNDKIIGSPGNDRIFGQAGKDDLRGAGGNDLIFGNLGKDKIYGGGGNDLLDGGDGADYVKGDRGDDLLYGGDGPDDLRGSEGNDVLLGQAGVDHLYGEEGQDELLGGKGTTHLHDHSVHTEQEWKEAQQQAMTSLEDKYHIRLNQAQGRVWTLPELHWLDMALEKARKAMNKYKENHPQNRIKIYRAKASPDALIKRSTHDGQAYHEMAIYDVAWVGEKTVGEKCGNLNIPSPMIETVVHELGHVFWFTVMTQSERKAFKNISGWKGDGTYSNANIGFVRNYGKTSKYEDWATHFAAYFLDSTCMKNEAPEKYAFFRSYFETPSSKTNAITIGTPAGVSGTTKFTFELIPGGDRGVDEEWASTYGGGRKIQVRPTPPDSTQPATGPKETATAGKKPRQQRP